MLRIQDEGSVSISGNSQAIKGPPSTISESLTSEQKQRQRDQIAREKTEKLAYQMYERTLRQTKLALARQSDIEEQLANVTQQLQELTSLVGQVDSNRQRNEQQMGQMEGRLKQLLEDGQFRKELRDIAATEAGKADEAFVMAIAQKAIRQALDAGVIPKQLQPKPERPAGD